MWRHGDWITITDRHSAIVHGRSNSTLNRNGIRIGSGDINRALEPLHEVEDALVVGIELPGGGYRMPIFVVVADGRQLDDGLRSTIVDAIRSGASPRHVADDVVQIDAVPHTLTDKRLEVPFKESCTARVQPMSWTLEPLSVRYGPLDGPQRDDITGVGRRGRESSTDGGFSGWRHGRVEVED